jgi:antitoxin component YwqK of YwqJK toxin-antitoxin module
MPKSSLIFLILTLMTFAGEPVLVKFGYAPGHTSLDASGWYADNKPDSGHATDFEDHFDYSRITVGLMNNFIRAYLWDVGTLPGVRSPGTITFRLRRRGHSSKIILHADGKSICTYLQKNLDTSTYDITGGTNTAKIVWGNDKALNQWHDYTLSYDGTNRTFIIDGDPKTRIELAQSKTPHKDHLSLGMGYEYGKEMYIDIQYIRFTPANAKAPVYTPPKRPDGMFVATYKNNKKWVEYNMKDGELNGPLTRWYVSGEKQNVATYVNGQPKGENTWWYANGRERLRTQHLDGKLHGQYVRYYPSGQLETSVQFRDGKAHGVFARWWPSGAPLFLGGYKMDLMHGYWARMQKNGNLLWAHMSTDGVKDVFVKTWHANGQPKSVEYLDRGVRHGFYTTYDKDGTVTSRTWFENGKAKK